MKIPDSLTRCQALYLLEKYLLDEDSTPVLSLDQVDKGYIKSDLVQEVNADRVHKILMKHSKRYRQQAPHKYEPLSYEGAIGIIMKYLLGSGYYIVDSVNMEQGNSVIVHDILKKYSKRYRNDIKEPKPDIVFNLFGNTITIKRKEKHK